MLGFVQTRQTTTTARIDGRDVIVKPGETLLTAALREGIDFPNSCRVGGCGACKCRVTQGEVRELTETGYLLTAQELQERTILACQSTPVTDVEIAVDLPEAIGGTVAAQTRLTHDITRVDVELDRPLDYRPGQFAQCAIDGLPDHTRSYSFATPPTPDGRIAFFIRHVPGGRFSGLVHAADVVGRRVEITGPSGDFWLRGSVAPLLFVAGGSGLAPILAILEAGADERVPRAVSVLFGARAQRDLYALEQLDHIAARWNGPFEVLPVLSDEPDDSDWGGARGLVTQHMAARLSAQTHAYVCGPPAMVDAALLPLQDAGVPHDHIHFDRFATLGDAGPPQVAGPVAGVLHYAKFCLFHVLGLLTVVGLLGGGWITTLTLAGVVAGYILGDRFGGDDTTTPRYTRPGLLTGLTWAALPLLALVVFTSVWTVCAGDPLGFGAGLSALTGIDLLAARDATGWGHHAAGLALTILTVGLVALIPGHELVHRTWDRTSLAIGRLLYAFILDAPFSIEHVYGHHRYVSTRDDPATAPRGRNVYTHVVVSTLRGNLSSWHLEAARLRRRKVPVWSHHNVWLRGHAMSVGLLIIAWLMGGPLAALWFVTCALGGKAILEMVNYMEHYGMVRDPNDPVQPHHSWNTNRRVSSWAMFNLTRHSHHHAQGETPFGELRPYPDAPMMVDGYLGTMFLTMIPPLWHHLMTPKVLQWDRDYATPKEKRMALEANRASGIPAFERADPALYRWNVDDGSVTPKHLGEL
jgi:NAD(P)H-flavin reductase/ferredoxin